MTTLNRDAPWAVPSAALRPPNAQTDMLLGMFGETDMAWLDSLCGDSFPAPNNNPQEWAWQMGQGNATSGNAQIEQAASGHQRGEEQTAQLPASPGWRCISIGHDSNCDGCGIASRADLAGGGVLFPSHRCRHI